MRTALSGTFCVRIFVASSPSIPGMRTSMITTSGLRRSASETAVAPSAASPTTRMCGARESDSRRPSRTTSWPSTIRQVISPCAVICSSVAPCSVNAGGLYGGNRLLERKRQLLGLRSRCQAGRAAVADAVLSGQVGDELAHGLRVGGTKIGTPRVEPLIGRQLLGVVLRERGQEVFAGPRPQVEQVRPDAAGA